LTYVNGLLKKYHGHWLQLPPKERGIHGEAIDAAVASWLELIGEDHKLPADTNEWPWEVKREVILKLQGIVLDLQTGQNRYLNTEADSESEFETTTGDSLESNEK
jgi:hypothetical protein